MNIPDIIAKAGGHDKVAASCGIGVTAVVAWSTRNVIPPKRWSTLARLCGVRIETVERWLAASNGRNGR